MLGVILGITLLCRIVGRFVDDVCSFAVIYGTNSKTEVIADLDELRLDSEVTCYTMQHVIAS